MVSTPLVFSGQNNTLCCYWVFFFFLLVAVTLLPPQLAGAATAGNQAAAKGECVMILHGLARTNRSMAKLSHYLEAAGYLTENIDYPSRKFTIETLSDQVIPQALRHCSRHSPSKIHFVTHSLGGILLRYYLDQHVIAELGRVVMLSPPNNGSEIVDKLGGWPGFSLINGPAGSQLGTGADGIPAQLGPATFEVGIITGSFSFNPFYSSLIKGDDDGKVSITSAKLQGMSDFVVVPHSHSFIMNSEVVLQKTENFLRHGKF